MQRGTIVWWQARRAADERVMNHLRPEDIISSRSNEVPRTKAPAEEARRAERFVYDKPTIDNTIVVFVDHQLGLSASLREVPCLSDYKRNVVALARAARALALPVLLTSWNTQGQNDDTLPELKDLFFDQRIHRRDGIINCYEDPSFRSALERVAAETGRRHVLISGSTIGICCVLPTLSMLQDGYQVYPVVDACGAWNRYETAVAMLRMARAGAELMTTLALVCEL